MDFKMDWDSYLARLPISYRVVRRLPDGVVVEESIPEARQMSRDEHRGSITDRVIGGKLWRREDRRWLAGKVHREAQ